ncbi:hypothetical protein LQ063_08265 [Enterococcus hirae]|uniref:hypothetical protein n=1 Tax=Enterococcus hirae TaxID=1354 RepID=UPI00201843F8|nr:hypothetical protein [Enterococcus hirae]UQR02747.1 hypothetical protein LQ063_08265 [Enterococcus hirae]
MDLIYNEALKNKVKEAVIYKFKRLFDCDICVLNVSDAFKVKVKFDFKKYNYSKISTFNYKNFAEEIAEDYPEVLDLTYTDINYNYYKIYKSYCIEQNVLKQLKKSIAKDLKSKFDEIIDRENLKINNNYYNFKLKNGHYMSLYVKNIDSKGQNLERYAANRNYDLLTNDKENNAEYFEWIKESAVELDKIQNLESDFLKIFNTMIKNEVEKKYKDTLIKAELFFFFNVNLIYGLKITINDNPTKVMYVEKDYMLLDLITTYINYNHKDTLNRMTKHLEKMKTKIIEYIEESIEK